MITNWLRFIAYKFKFNLDFLQLRIPSGTDCTSRQQTLEFREILISSKKLFLLQSYAHLVVNPVSYQRFQQNCKLSAGINLVIFPDFNDQKRLVLPVFEFHTQFLSSFHSLFCLSCPELINHSRDTRS